MDNKQRTSRFQCKKHFVSINKNLNRFCTDILFSASCIGYKISIYLLIFEHADIREIVEFTNDFEENNLPIIWFYSFVCNLKKILALVLAFACAFTMFAGAAFTDQADIKVKDEVVDTLVELGVIEGFEDGSFQPNATVTRAQMAKMIYVLRTGNSDASAYNDDKTSFTDIGSHWARGYIKYCQSLGIIAGKSNTIFAPNASVTAQEAAKMLLVTLGYDAQKAGLVGSGWASKTNALADENGLLDDVNTSFTAACPRQYAAQLIYNTIDTPTVVWRDDAYTSVTLLGDDNQTVGEKYMSLKKSTSTLTNVVKTNGKDTYTVTLDSTASVVDWDNTTESKDSGKAIFEFTDVKKDYSDLLYKTVTVLHKDRKTVYGVFATSDNSQQSNVLKKLEMDGAKVKLDGTKYDLADKTAVYVNGEKLTDTNDKDVTIKAFVDAHGNKAANKYKDSKYWQGTEVSLMATDGTSNYSILKVKTFAVAKVTAVGSDYINVTYKRGDKDIVTKTKLEDDEWDWYDGVKKDDYVILTAKGNYGTNHGLVEKAEVVTGKVTGTKSDDGVSVGGNWYTMAGVQGQSNTDNRPNTGSKVDMVIVNGYVYFVDTTAGSVEDVALLVEAAKKGGTGSKWEARMIFADGSDKTVDIEKKWEDKDNDQAGATIPTMVEGTDTPVLVTYSVSNGVYTLTKIGAKHVYDGNDFETAGYDGYAAVTTKAATKTDGSIKNADKIEVTEHDGTTKHELSKLYYEATGTVFVKYKVKTDGSADYKVVTGKTASGYDKALTEASAVVNKSGNSWYAQAAYINIGDASTGGSDDNYAVITDDVVKDTTDGTKYVISAWNGSQTITIKTEDSKVKNLSGGTLITYSGDLNDADVSVKTADNYFVSDYDVASGDITLLEGKLNQDASDKTKYTGTLTKKTESGKEDRYGKVDSKDTIVMFVNSDDSKGVTGMDYTNINLAYAFDSDFCTTTNTGNTYTITGLSEDATPNVMAYFDDNDQITVLVVDVNRNITQW